ncbi:MAG: hypothetical protein NVS2B17_10230 [Candidatus Velthaea sp.]
MQHAHLVHGIAQVLSAEMPIGELLAQCCVPLALLLDARRVSFAVRSNARDRIIYEWEDSAGAPPLNDEVRSDSLIARVFAADETVADSDERGAAIAVPIRFGRTLLGVLALDGAAKAELDAVTLVEACALHIGARIYYENTLQSSERFATLAFTDGLTSIANRRKFDEALAREWSRGARERWPVTLLLIDIDFFKDFNDSYGHHAGDVCLQHVARALADGVKRPSDLCARYGGEEFVALLPGTDLQGGIILAEQLRESVAALHVAHNGSSLGCVSLSIGVASCIPSTDAISSDLVRTADRALYAGKTAGRNRVVAKGYASQAKAAERTQAVTPNNLPLPLTRLIGRRAEIREARTVLEREQMVTIAGAAGIGKSRIALQIATESLDAFPDGVWFADLSSLSDAALAPAAIAALFGGFIGANESGSAAFTRIIGDKRALLVIDNGEHLVHGLAPLVTTLLRCGSNLRVLLGSRRPLGIGGEAVYHVPPLALPPEGPCVSADAASAYDAVALFVERAKAASRTFVFNDANAAAVVEICRQTEGAALALELIAARLTVLDVGQLAQRLGERLRLAREGAGTGVPARGTLRIFIDWVYDLLAERERTVLRRLAVFAGRWRLEAACDIISGDGIDPDDVFDLIASLMRKALVVDDIGSDGESAYRLLDPLREYGAERLREKHERERVAHRHADYFLRVARHADASAESTPVEEWIRTYERDLDNFRAALQWSSSGPHDVELGVELSSILSRLRRRRKSAGLSLERP